MDERELAGDQSKHAEVLPMGLDRVSVFFCHYVRLSSLYPPCLVGCPPWF